MEKTKINKKKRAGGFKTKQKKNNARQAKTKLNKAKQSKGWTIQTKPHVDLVQFNSKSQNSEIPKKYMDIDDKNLLAAILYPITVSEFRQKYYRKKALVIKAGDVNRFSGMVKEHLYNLNLEELCENTASDQVHIWYPDRDNKSNKKFQNGVDSFGTNDIPLALKAHQKGGASLYFGSPVEFRELFCKSLANQLGMNFSAYFSDFTSMSECEIFVSKKGGYTDYHIDFQENFSIQLKGRKKWRVCKSGITSPLVGFTPHYNNTGNLEYQMKMIRMELPFNYDKNELEAIVDEVELCPGDIFYHPAGIWHSVECVDDSFTINLSLKNYNKADLIAQSLKHLMNQDPELRENITFTSREDLNHQIQSGLEKAFELMKDLCPEVIVPQNMIIPRYLKFDFTNPEQMEHISLKFKGDLTSKSKVYFNPLSMILKKSDIPQDELPDSDYVIHHNYAGHPEYQSMMRVELVADEESRYFLDKLVELRASEPNYQMNLKDIDWKKDQKLVQIIKVLIYTGFFVIDEV